jgi:MYXO-CTERM domain-containing protein
MRSSLTTTTSVAARVALAGGALACAALAATPQHAAACGGFFCNSAQPVNQSAERIIFTHDASGTVTAVIQIQYAGEADDFAWVLPVAGTPDVGVSSNLAFARLQAATNPQYLLTTRVEGTCRDDGRLFASPSAGGGADAAAAAGDGGPAVTVLESGSVGPYDFVVIAIDPAAAPLSDVAVEWLHENEFDIDEAGAALLQPYLESGMNLLAFRLTKGNDVGSIRPVTITFGTGLASIPLRPTAVAAVEDMGVMVWVLGEHRAVPVNYASLELNEALINWINPGPSYGDVVDQAADEAGGHGFVTEMAGASEPLAEVVYASWERDQWTALASGSWTGREGELLWQAASNLGSFDGIRDVIAATVPVPTGVTMEELLACVTCYYGYEDTDIDGFTPSAFLDSMRTNVIEPMERTRALFVDQPYVTRFYTTMSAAEMNVDPMFDFNADLADVSNVHNAERVIECSPSISQADAPWRVALPGGDTVRGSGATWPFTIADGSMPANARVIRVGTEGTGEVIADNVGLISEALTDHNLTIRPPTPSAAATCGCRAGSSGSSSAALFAMLGLGALIAARRRR